MREPANNGVASAGEFDDVVEIINTRAAPDVVLVCEHASNHIPPHLNGLGLDEAAQTAHVAWDPGARTVSSELSARLDAPLVASRVSRLVYDCNRPPEAPGAMPVQSEQYHIPGNAGLTPDDRKARVERYYLPFHNAVTKVLSKAHQSVAMVTVHSFAPIYFGNRRDVEIGILHDDDSRLADGLLDIASAQTERVVRRNEPYSAKDGVTHTLRRHAIDKGLLNVMLEIRNDLIRDEQSQRQMGQMIANWLQAALANLRQVELAI